MSRGFTCAMDTDSYKASHYLQFPPGVTWTQSHFIPRSSDDKEIVFFGLQTILADLKTPDRSEVLHMGNFFEDHGLPFNYKGWAKIADLGYYPIKVHALPEGTLVPIGIPCFTVESTDPETFWIERWLETQMLRCWHMINVATISYNCRKIIWKYLEQTSEDPQSEIDFKLNDFGSRGCSTGESAAMGGLGHLLSFKGSDNVVSILAAQRYYGCKMAGFSIPAGEHATMCSWGESGEREAIHNLLNRWPNKPVAFPADTWDLKHATHSLGFEEFRDKIKTRKFPIVVRPDSGDPVMNSIVTIKRLISKFGYVVNSKQYKVLPNYVRVIYGDGIRPSVIEEILHTLAAKKLSASNICFGMGGALLQQHNRDTHGIAYKLNAIEINGQKIGVCKNSPGKKSFSGVYDDPRFKTVYNNGEHVTETLDEIRWRLWP